MMRRDENGNFQKSRSRNRREWAVILGMLLLVVFRLYQVNGRPFSAVEAVQTEVAGQQEESGRAEKESQPQESNPQEEKSQESEGGQQSKEDEAEEELVSLSLHAAAAVLMDGYTGRVLYEKNASQILPMASTTKIMTCILAFEYGDPEGLVEVSSYAASMPDVQLNINKGEQYRLEDLLLSLMLESHNDAAAAIAEHIAEISLEQQRETIRSMWTEEEWELIETAEGKKASERSAEESKALVAVFAGLMNRKAASIGCENTCFVTPNGLDATGIRTAEDGTQEEIIHSTTAQELALIMRYCLSGSEKSSQFTELTRTRSASFTEAGGNRSFSCNNHNSYLDMKEGAISGKTGFTNKAGYCYVGAVNQNGVYLIVALLACGWPPSKTLKWQDMNTLVNYGLENYSCVQVKGLRDDPVDYLVPVQNAKGKENGLETVKTEISFEPFTLLMKAGESLSENWYVEYKDAEEGTEIGICNIMAGKSVCKSLPVRISKREKLDK